jgi:integrase
MAKRRGNFEGSIRQRRKGLWEGRLRIDGKRVSVYGATRAEVSERLAEKRTAASQGRVVHETGDTVGAFLGDWLALQRSRLRPRSYAECERYVGKLIAHLGSVKLRDLKPRRIERLYVELETAGLGLCARARVHKTLHAALEHAVRQGELSRNPSACVVAPRYQAPEVTKWSEAEVKALLKVTDATFHAALARLLPTGGLRIGEALALQWRDIDWKTGAIRIERQQVELGQKAKPEDRVRWDAPLKSKASRRIIELPQATMDAMRVRKAQDAERRLRKGLGAPPLPLVFTGPRRGRPLYRSHLLRKWWWPCLKNAGLKQCGFHVARHTHATLLLSQGQNPGAVARRLGHSVAVSMRAYAGALPSDDRRIVDPLEAALR